MTNRPNGTLYVGVTNDLARRAWEHRGGLVDGFTQRFISSVMTTSETLGSVSKI